jgi:NAD(P)-dependent dehydrogenase (short-subunit alcohol dehydrogenase family)
VVPGVDATHELGSQALAGTVSVVTGAGRGIGRAIAVAMAAAGAKVVANDLGVEVDGSSPSTGPADEVVADIVKAGGEAVPCYESVATMAGGRAVVECALDTFGRVDTAVCAAGILRPATIFDMTEAEWDDVITTNLKGHFSVIQPAARAIRNQQSGSIITFTSTGGLEGNPKQPNYSASKEGIIGLTRAVALSIAPYATCNAISPTGRSRMTLLPALQRPKGHIPDPELITPMAIYLASPASRHITGQVIAIGGDRVAAYPQPRPYQSAFRDGGWSAAQIEELWATRFAPDELVRYRRYFQSASQGS